MDSNSIHVLLIEDNAKDAAAMQKILREVKSASIRLDKVKNLSDGLEILAKGDVDAVLLDNSLPDGQGLDNLVKVRAIAKDAPVIVLSDRDDPVTESEVISLGAQDFLMKKRVNSRAMARILHYAIERQRIRMTLENAVAKLQELNQLKSDFISSVSHELHTPLTVITVASNNFIDGIFGDLEPVQMKWIERIKSNADRLTNLINDILDLAKLEAGRVKLNWKRFDIVRMTLETLEDIVPISEKRRIAIHKNLPKGPVEVYAAEGRVQQVLVNLLTNAVKYTPEGGEIRVTLTTDGEGVRMEVADNGQGIDPTKLDIIFERFLQLGRDKTSTPGIGLGLAICKEIMALHHGRLWAESEGVGLGSRFIFTLPFDLQSKTLQKPTVLVVDNDPSVLELLGIVLKELQCDVIEAKDGAEAIGHLVSSGKHSPIDLLVVDMMLPVRNGVEVIQEAKRVNPDTVIVIITGFPDHTLLSGVMKHGNFTLIRKPFKFDEIKRALNPILSAINMKEKPA
ncbi:MAG: hypothetical protein A2901_09190 [Elusimicrobia bacterium RIFCSPLOWO2_01_FULL_54_10]|nr:MAG: hypothetical protein A2901_09190 [Elusimicrobia bacterium RIFCSPLOWO2_01_FULL_54_10]